MVVVDEIASIAKIAEEEEDWVCLLAELLIICIVFCILFVIVYMLCVSKAFVKEEEEELTLGLTACFAQATVFMVAHDLWLFFS